MTGEVKLGPLDVWPSLYEGMAAQLRTADPGGRPLAEVYSYQDALALAALSSRAPDPSADALRAENERLREAADSAVEILRDAKTRCDQVARNWLAVGAIATQGQTAAHEINSAIERLTARQSLGGRDDG